MGIGALGRPFDGGAAGVRESVGDVVRDRVLEQDRLLDDHADLGAKAAELDLADVVAVDANRAGIDIPEPRDQVHEGRLAAAVGADQGDRFTLSHRKVDSVQDRAGLRCS